MQNDKIITDISIVLSKLKNNPTNKKKLRIAATKNFTTPNIFIIFLILANT